MKLSRNSVSNIPVFSISNPKGIDVIITALQAKLFDDLDWLDKSFGRAFEMKAKMGDDDNQDDYVFPAVMTGEKRDLEDVLALDTDTAYSFMVARGEEVPADDETVGTVQHQEIYSRDLHLIVWMNLASTSETIEDRKRQIRQSIYNTRFEFGCDVVINGIFDEPDDVFDGFSLDAAESQNLYPPYHGVRFVLRANYFQCT